MHRALLTWARALAHRAPQVRQVGYFGSYAREDWGVGSDLDVLVLVSEAGQPFEQRAAAFDATTLPVPADLLVYTQAEWPPPGDRFRKEMEQTVVWVFPEEKNEGGL